LLEKTTALANQGYPALYFHILTPLIRYKSLPSDPQRSGGTYTTRAVDEWAYSLPSSSFVLPNLRTQSMPESTTPWQWMRIHQHASALVGIGCVGGTAWWCSIY